MGVDNHMHCQATVLGAIGLNQQGSTWGTLSELGSHLTNLGNNWLNSFTDNENITDDLADILRLINGVSGDVKTLRESISSIQQQVDDIDQRPLPGQLITVNGSDNRTVNVKNDIGTEYSGLVGITTGENRQFTEMPLIVQSSETDGPLIATIKLGDDEFEIHVPSYITITLDPCGGKIRKTEIQVYKGTAIGDVLPTPTYALNWGRGEFQGWYTEENGGGTKVDSNSVFFQDTILYAHWSCCILYEKIGDVIVDKNGVASNFWGNRYLISCDSIDYSTDYFEIVFYATVADVYKSGELEIYTTYPSTIDVDIGANFSSWGSPQIYRSAWEFPGYGVDGQTNGDLRGGTSYYFKMVKNGKIVKCYISQDGENWIEEVSNAASEAFSGVYRFVIGMDTSYSPPTTQEAQAWPGTIDLSKSYFKAYGRKYRLIDIEDYKVTTNLELNTPGTYQVVLSEGTWDIVAVGGGGGCSMLMRRNRPIFFAASGNSSPVLKGSFTLNETTPCTIQIGDVGESSIKAISNLNNESVQCSAGGATYICKGNEGLSVDNCIAYVQCEQGWKCVNGTCENTSTNSWQSEYNHFDNNGSKNGKQGEYKFTPSGSGNMVVSSVDAEDTMYGKSQGIQSLGPYTPDYCHGYMLLTRRQQ